MLRRVVRLTWMVGLLLTAACARAESPRPAPPLTASSGKLHVSVLDAESGLAMPCKLLFSAEPHEHTPHFGMGGMDRPRSASTTRSTAIRVTSNSSCTRAWCTCKHRAASNTKSRKPM
jgi:hypothetical protein